MTKAETDVLLERAKQRQKWGDDHDQEHREGFLSSAGAWLALHSPVPWPSVATANVPDWLLVLADRHDRRERLVMAAAFIIAEIDRCDSAGGR